MDLFKTKLYLIQDLKPFKKIILEHFKNLWPFLKKMVQNISILHINAKNQNLTFFLSFGPSLENLDFKDFGFF